MPPRSVSLALRLSAHERPILPFLAPRVFTPYAALPLRRRAHGASPHGSAKPQHECEDSLQIHDLQSHAEEDADLNTKEEIRRKDGQAHMKTQQDASTKRVKSSKVIAIRDPIYPKQMLDTIDEKTLPPLHRKVSSRRHYNYALREKPIDHRPEVSSEDSGLKASQRKSGRPKSGTTFAASQSSKGPDFWKSYGSTWSVVETRLPFVRVSLSYPKQVPIKTGHEEWPQQLNSTMIKKSYRSAFSRSEVQKGAVLSVKARSVIRGTTIIGHQHIRRTIGRQQQRQQLTRRSRVSGLNPQKLTADRRASRREIISKPRDSSLDFLEPPTAELQRKWRRSFRYALRNFDSRSCAAANTHPDQVIKPRMNAFVRLRPKELLQDAFNTPWNITLSGMKMQYEFGFAAHQYRGLANTRSNLPLSFWDVSCEEITRKWSSVPIRRRSSLWRSVMTIILRNDPVLALKFLVATSFPPYPAGYAITDSIEFIVDRVLAGINKEHPINVKSLMSIITGLLDHVEQDHFHLSGPTIRNLVRVLDGEQLAQFYDKLVQCNHPLNTNVVAHLITALAKTKQTRLAIDCVRWLQSNNRADFSKPEFEAVCSTLLQHKNRALSPDAPSDAEIFSLMLDCGLRPNIITYNILLRNAIDTEDSDTALHIHGMMSENGVIPDGYTYAILLNDAKRRMDRAEIDRIFDIATRSKILNQFSVTDFIHAIFLMAEEDKISAKGSAQVKWEDSLQVRVHDPPFKRMLEIYSRHFDTQPLWDVIPNYPSLLAADPTKWRPSRQLLIIMLTGLLRELNNNTAIQSIYDKLREQIANGHKDLKALAHSTHVYDAIVKAFGRSDETLRRCTSVIRHMIVSHTQDIRHVAPSVRTWSILLKAFMDHQQPRAAEKVLSMMEERGIEPSLVTWNTLITGYAKLQDTLNTTESIHRMQTKGWELDEKGLRGILFLQDRGPLLLALKSQAANMTIKQKQVDRYLADLVRKVVRRGQMVPLSKDTPLRLHGKDMTEGEVIGEVGTEEDDVLKNQVDNKSSASSTRPIILRDFVFPSRGTPDEMSSVNGEQLGEAQPS